MKLKEAEFKLILNKYLNGEASQKEMDFLHAYYDAFEPTSGYTNQLSPDEHLILEHRIQGKIFSGIQSPARGSVIRMNLLKYVAVIGFISLLAVTYLIYRNKSSHDSVIKVALKKKQPKTDDVVLTLANGTRISLTNDAISASFKDNQATVQRHNNVPLKYNGAQQQSENYYNQVNVPPGKQFQLTLEDGTRIWLNAASSLKYPGSFKANQRNVYLTGEAYFEVSKDKEKPFIVYTRESEIKVLGTQFNVHSSSHESKVITTLVEGSVRVAYANETINLLPGEQSTSNVPNLAISKSQADVENAIAWKSGFFIFNHPLNEVMDILSQWYGKKIILDQRLWKSTIAGKFSNKRSLTQILTYMGQVKGFTIQKRGDIFELKANR